MNNERIYSKNVEVQQSVLNSFDFLEKVICKRRLFIMGGTEETKCIEMGKIIDYSAENLKNHLNSDELNT